VRILGRGGAGARPRKSLKGEDIHISSPDLQIPCSSPHQPGPIIRPMGRGGMGSHPKNAHSKSKSVSQKSQLVPDIFLLLHRTKTEKKRRKGKEVSVDGGEPRFDTARASELSFTTISSIHFAGETDGPPPPPPPDFFVVKRRKNEGDGLSFVSEDLEQEEDEQKNLSTAARRFSKLFRTLGDVPTAMLRQALMMDDDQTPATMSDLRTNRDHRQRFSLPVFPTTVLNTTTNCDRESPRMLSPFDESQLYDSESSTPPPFPESQVTELSTPSPTSRFSEESYPWSGEWNARLPDVIHALRELRC
jgi:hypothetical protein